MGAFRSSVYLYCRIFSLLGSFSIWKTLWPEGQNFFVPSRDGDTPANQISLTQPPASLKRAPQWFQNHTVVLRSSSGAEIPREAKLNFSGVPKRPFCQRN
jgi:hypothetical protein